jgi:DNA-binding NtrC family response regulator
VRDVVPTTDQGYRLRGVRASARNAPDEAPPRGAKHRLCGRTKTAIELFERHAGEIDLLVTDVVMPDLNGPALAQRLVGDWPELRVLFMSGYADHALAEAVIDARRRFIGKPYQPSALMATVHAMLTA